MYYLITYSEGVIMYFSYCQESEEKIKLLEAFIKFYKEQCFPGGSEVKNPPAMRENQVQSLSQ